MAQGQLDVSYAQLAEPDEHPTVCNSQLKWSKRRPKKSEGQPDGFKSAIGVCGSARGV